jgi:hypothetical protein
MIQDDLPERRERLSIPGKHADRKAGPPTRISASGDGSGIAEAIIVNEVADVAANATCCFLEAAASNGDCCLAEAASSFATPDCFVATAALEPCDPHDHPDLNALRLFRDQVLRRSAPGRAFARAYYRWGRYPAGFIRNKPMLKLLTRVFLVRPAAALSRLCTRL